MEGFGCKCGCWAGPGGGAEAWNAAVGQIELPVEGDFVDVDVWAAEFVLG